MAEKVKVKSLTIKKEGMKDNKAWKITEVTLEDGRKGDSFQEFKEGEECEIEVKPNSNPNYNAQFTKVMPKKAGFAPKDYTFEKKRVALECTVSLIASGKVEMKNMEECRNKFFNYLNEK